MKFKVKWPQFNKTVEVVAGSSILDAALDNDIPLDHACGGYCACTTCHVYVVQGINHLTSIEPEEQERLEFKDHQQPNSRLGCQAKINGDLEVVIPNYQP